MCKSIFDEIVNAIERVSDIHAKESNEIVEVGMMIDDNRWISYNNKYDCIIFYNLGQEELVIPRSSKLVDMMYSLFDSLFELKYDMK